MALSLYYHPLASFCHKVLIALYENDTPFTGLIVGGDPAVGRALTDLWPIGKFPVLHDHARGRTIPETSIIIEYLQQHYPGARPLLAEEASQQLDARLWDRFFDLYVHAPMQKIVLDRRRDAGDKDPRGVEDADATLATAYRMLEERMPRRDWVAGDAFGMADCAAAPALFYASIVRPFTPGQTNLAAYFDRLMDRASVRRVIREARPYFDLFPFKDLIPPRFL